MTAAARRRPTLHSGRVSATRLHQRCWSATEAGHRALVIRLGLLPKSGSGRAVTARLRTCVVGIGAERNIRIPIRLRRRIGPSGIVVVSRIIVAIAVARIIIVIGCREITRLVTRIVVWRPGIIVGLCVTRVILSVCGCGSSGEQSEAYWRGSCQYLHGYLQVPKIPWSLNI